MTCEAPSAFHQSCPREPLEDSDFCYLHQDERLDLPQFREHLNEDIERIVENGGAAVDLSYGNFPPIQLRGGIFPDKPVILNKATFQGTLRLEEVESPELSLAGADSGSVLILRSEIGSLALNQLRAEGGVRISGCQVEDVEARGCRVRDTLQLEYSSVKEVGFNGVADSSEIHLSNIVCSSASLNGSRVSDISIDKVTVFDSLTLSPMQEIEEIRVARSRIRDLHLQGLRVPKIRIEDSTILAVNGAETDLGRASFTDVRVETFDLHESHVDEELEVEDVIPRDDRKIEAPNPSRDLQPFIGKVQRPPFPENWIEEKRPRPEPVTFDDEEVRHPEVFKQGLIVNRKCRPMVALHDLQLASEASMSLRGNLHLLEMKRFLLLGTDVTKIRFRNVSWPRRNGRRTTVEALSLRQAIETGPRAETQREFFRNAANRPRLANHPWLRLRLLGWLQLSDAIFEKVGAQLRAFRMNLEDDYRYHDAGDFFVEEMDMRRLAGQLKEKQGLRSRVHTGLLTVYRRIARYGESYLNVAGSFAISLIILSLGFPEYSLSTTPKETIMTGLWALKKSLLAMMGLEASTIYERGLRLVGLAHLGLFLITLRRQFMRHSSLSR